MKFLRVPLAIALLLIPVGIMAQRSRPISLGSIAPANSLWDRALKQMATDVQRATDRRVRLRIAANTQGDEAAIVRRLMLGTTQAAALSQIGLEELDESFSVLGMPFFFGSDAEARHVLEALRPGFERALADRDLVLINWAHGGWAHLFSAERISSLQEVKQAKLFTTAGDDRMVRWYRQNGFDPVPLELSDVPVGLNTGLINASPFPPYFAMLLQHYRAAPYMLDLPLGPIMTATVMTTRSWRQLSEEDQGVLLSVGKAVEDRLFREVPQQDTEAVAEMEKRGLQVTKLDPAAVAEFRRAADELNVSLRGQIVPTGVYDQAVRARDAYRAR